MIKQKAILITGVAGFIGYHLCNRLLLNGYQVIGVDNLNNYYSVNLKISRLKLIGIEDQKFEENKPYNGEKFKKNFIFYKSDINDRSIINSPTTAKLFSIKCLPKT